MEGFAYNFKLKYGKSRKSLNKSLDPIYVAVHPNDPYKTHPRLRTHGRPLDGVQRYEDSLALINQLLETARKNIQNNLHGNGSVEQ